MDGGATQQRLSTPFSVHRDDRDESSHSLPRAAAPCSICQPVQRCQSLVSLSTDSSPLARCLNVLRFESIVQWHITVRMLVSNPEASPLSASCITHQALFVAPSPTLNR